MIQRWWAGSLYNLESHFRKNNSKLPNRKVAQGPMGHLAGFLVPPPRAHIPPFSLDSFSHCWMVMPKWQASVALSNQCGTH